MTDTGNRNQQGAKTKGLLYAVVRGLLRNRTAAAGLAMVVVLAVVGILAPVLAPYDPLAPTMRERLTPPTSRHWLGQDELGRDILSRVIYGARISLTIGIVAVGVGMAVGVPWGLLSGFYGGRLDLISQRLLDILLAFPPIILVILVVTVLGPGLWNAMIVIGITSVPNYSRVVRGSVLTLRDTEYVQAARAQGASDVRILARHVLPNVLGPVVVLGTLYTATAILTAAGLGFLGLGAQAPTPEWGAMLSRGREYLRVAPHVSAFPGLAILFSVLGFNLLGDGLRDALDPRLRGVR